LEVDLGLKSFGIDTEILLQPPIHQTHVWGGFFGYLKQSIWRDLGEKK